VRREIAFLKKEIQGKINRITDQKELKQVRIEFLGRRQGKLTSLLKQLVDLPLKERPELGKLINDLKSYVQEALDKKEKVINEEKNLEEIDITLPGKRPLRGGLHPLTQILQEIKRIFATLGFEVVRGPEIETEYYNFEALNMPKFHPARDEQDSFYLSRTHLLRTQTSPVQIRVMEQQTPPVRVIAPGKCYRRDAIDASHYPMFHQVEGLAVDEGIAFSDLKGTLTYFVHQMFGPNRELRFRPSFFPFTEPSAEVDISCAICQGKGCRVCSGKGWLEILGAGMVDPEVFKKVNYNPEQYQGFAFGMGVERICMLKYGVDDIRHFFQNDLRFLRQF